MLIGVGALVACGDLAGLTGGGGGDPPPTPVGSPCGDLRCVHGTCSSAGKCECAAGFSGPSCDSCGGDLQDKDGDGACQPSCNVTTCPARSRCDDTSGKATCVCSTGYALEGDACVWKGGIQDPGFQNTPPGAWKLSGGALIDATAKDKTQVDPGYVDFPQENPFGAPDAGPPRCTYGQTSHAIQTVKMPPFAEAEPFALSLSRQSVCSPIFGFCFGETYRFSVGGRAAFVDRADGLGQSAFSPRKVCLGERAYGGDVTFDVAAPCGSQVEAVRVDRATLVPDATCPAPGKVQNGDFEGTGGWAASGVAEVTALVGTAQSRGARIKMAKACDYGQLTGSLSVPWKSVPRPALTFSFKGSKNKQLSVRVGGSVAATVTGTDTFETARVCLPDWATGTVQQLAFYAYASSAAGNCTDPDTSEFIFDDVKIESEPTCEDPGLVFDGGFERRGSVSAWSGPSSPTSGVFTYASGAPPSSHSGAGYGALYSPQCNYASLYQTASVPDLSPGKGGPMLAFWYRTSAAASGAFYSTAGTLPVAAAWTKKTYCLPPTLAGRATSINFSASTSSGGGACANPPYLYLDDVAITLDPTCPEK